jgi:hypothetical protein
VEFVPWSDESNSIQSDKTLQEIWQMETNAEGI